MGDRNRPTPTRDRRTARTRKALLEAFVSLFFARRYDRIKIGDIVTRAGVSRSTFYEHFADKDALLAESLRRPLSLLVNAVATEPDEQGLSGLLAHFWSQQQQARHVFGGSPRRAVGRILAAMLADALRPRLAKAGSEIPLDLVAIALAEALLVAVHTWLGGLTGCDAVTLAVTLRRLVQGATR
jgi:AcrR family transcriptional regulator